MENRSATVGFLEVRTPADLAERDGSLVIDFRSDESDFELMLNGGRFAAASPAELAASIEAHRVAESGRPVSIPFEVAVEGLRVIIGQGADVAGSQSGVYLTGAAAQAAVDKALRIVNSVPDAWPSALPRDPMNALDLDQLPAGSRWDGPIVVSMPRTGSTLMGLLFLFCRDPAAATGYRFDRYVHEPIAPVYWRGDELGSITRSGAALTPRDVVQESAYQFADPAIAQWFLKQAKSPVIFTMRHPQLAWPSRWRAMLAQMLDQSPAGAMAETVRAALAEDNFSELGQFLTESVRPADNGFYSFMALVDVCIREGIDFVIVDNTRFRAHPEATMRELCSRLGFDFDPAMTEWTDLSDVLPRVVMSDLALGDEYEWYYARTLASDTGILPETHSLVPGDRFPSELRGSSEQHLTIDEAVTWHQMLLTRPETLP